MGQALLSTIACRGSAVALRSSDGAVEIRYDELTEHLRAVAAALAALGVRRGDTVGMMLTNRPEFHVIDAAAMLMGAVPFSVYNTAPPNQLAYVMGDAGARIVLTERQFAPLIAATGAHGLDLDHVIVIDDHRSWRAFLQRGGAFDLAAAAAAVAPDDLLTLIYTSGTTGAPKGVQLTHANMLAMLASLHAVWSTRMGGRVLSYLPHAHAADRWFSHYSAFMTYGATVTDVAALSDLISTTMQVRPTSWGGVPRVWEKLKAALQAGAFGPLDDPVRVRELIGLDSCELFVIGAAPTTRDVLEFFADLGIEICEVWGMSETSAIGTVNRPGAVRLGSVGQPLPGLEVRLAHDGELLCRGASVMAGYRNRPTKTAEAIDAAGWLHTGDIARIDEDGFVWISDRKKELMINTAGKNMSPANIEAKLKAAGPLIGQACVIGDRRKYNSALLVLDPEMGTGLDPEHPGTIAAVQREVDVANAALSRVEQIKRFALLADEWLPGGDELTPTMKLKRRPILEKYAATISALYD
jgi:long-subunit acyl-CoA synthetase (AMP-forming)